MRILINGLAVFRGGSQTYFSNFIPHLGRLGQHHEFVLLQSPWQDDVLNFELPSNFTRLVVGPKRRSVPLRVLWEQTRLPDILRHEKIDVMFSPTPITTLFSPCPLVIAIRNSNIFSTLPVKNWRYQGRNRLLRIITQLATKRAAGIIFVSKYSHEAALKKFNIDPTKAVVIYHGIGPHFFEPVTKASAQQYNGSRPYVLTVSTVSIHKNYFRFIDAFARLCQEPDLGYDYVFAGAVSSKEEFKRIEERISQPDLQGRVHYLGSVSYSELPALYQQASLFVLPSLLETFGHPLVEAMASGVPIATANTAAMLEICGEAAVYFDPYNIDDMSNTVRNILQDNALRQQLVAAGRKRATRFSWENTTQQMLDLFEAAVDKSKIHSIDF